MTSPDAVLDENDLGDDVAERFHYQHCYAAINAIKLIFDQSMIEIICENHEDFLVKSADGKFVGTQIKTRSLNRPPFRANDTQVKSAFNKFCLLDKQFPGCFDKFDFTTNHGFWTEAETENNLPWLLDEIRERGGIKGLRTTNPLRQFADGIAAGAGLQVNEVVDTLKKIVLRSHDSDITTIRFHVREALIECPGIKELPYFLVVAIADAIIALARDASKIKFDGSVTDLYAPGTDLAKVLQDQRLAGKRISREDVVAVVDQLKQNGAAYQDICFASLITPADVPSDLVLAIRKLAVGGVEAARVTNVEDLVRSFEALFLQWTRKYGAEEATLRYQNVLAVAQFEATEAQVQAATSGVPYGSKMYSILIDRLRVRSRVDADQLYKCRPEHLLGAVGLLTEQCKAWWSPKFNVHEEAT